MPKLDANNGPFQKLRILLSCGRFPVSLDLARQLRKAGHSVFTVDPMEYHVCKFSIAVKQSWQVPAPSRNAGGYVEAVKKAVRKANIDMIIPIHEEIFYLAESEEPEITKRLFAPPFAQLYRLHNKWEFCNTLTQYGLDAVETHLCTTRDHVAALDSDCEWALKPVIGRASTGVYHLKPGKKLEWSAIDLSDNHPYLAQKWTRGNRYCAYGVFRDGRAQALAVYPVLETIDGSSSVYFQASEHDGVREYITALTERLGFTGQMGLDLIEEGPDECHIRDSRWGKYRQFGHRLRHPRGRGGSPPADETGTNGADHTSHSEKPTRLFAIDCNPRATSGIHLWSGTPNLAHAFENTDHSLPEFAAQPGFSIQTAPGMLMWEHSRTDARRYFQHLDRLLRTRDVIWSVRDLAPVLLQPFLLASYYRICHDKGGIPLADMFQDDLIWKPGGFRTNSPAPS